MKIPFCLPTAKDILAHPKQFFEKDFHKINYWKKHLLYLLILTIVGAFFVLKQPSSTIDKITDQIFQVMNAPAIDLSPTVGVGAAIGIYIGTVALLLFITSLKYWIAHWFVKMYNNKAKLKETYAVLTYGGTPGWIAMPFSVLFFLFFYLGTQNGMTWWMWLSMILSLILWVALEGYSMYLRTYALSKIQKIKYWQAFLSIYILGLVAFLLVVFLLEAALLLFVASVFAIAGMMF